MKKFFLLLVSAVLAYSCTQSGYVLTGHVSDSSLVDHNVFLSEVFSEENFDTTIVGSDGTFVFNGSIGKDENAFLARLSVEYSECNSIVVIENGRIKVDFKTSGENDLPYVGGTPMNDAVYALHDGLKRNEESIAVRLDSISRIISITEEERQLLSYECLDEFRNEYCKKCNEVFSANKNNVAGVLSVLYWSTMDSDLDVDSIAMISGEVVSNNPTIQQMAASIRMAKATKPGNPYVDLSGVDASGNGVNLSQYVGNGKLLLVDFWASWCVPCKEEIPYIAAVVKKYGNKVNVVGLNVWDNFEEFCRVRDEYKITWPQIVDPTGQTFTDKYGISGIPQIILIGNDGTILARDLRGDAIAETIEKYL